MPVAGRLSVTPMPSQTEATSAGAQNIQDVFLNGARRERLAVTVQLMDGSRLDGTIKSFDRFSVVLEHGGVDQLVFKHAIAHIRPALSAP